jgi:hypothetical protein
VHLDDRQASSLHTIEEHCDLVIAGNVICCQPSFNLGNLCSRGPSPLSLRLEIFKKKIGCRLLLFVWKGSNAGKSIVEAAGHDRVYFRLWSEFRSDGIGIRSISFLGIAFSAAFTSPEDALIASFGA